MFPFAYRRTRRPLREQDLNLHHHVECGFDVRFSYCFYSLNAICLHTWVSFGLPHENSSERKLWICSHEVEVALCHCAYGMAAPVLSKTTQYLLRQM